MIVENRASGERRGNGALVAKRGVKVGNWRGVALNRAHEVLIFPGVDGRPVDRFLIWKDVAQLAEKRAAKCLRRDGRPKRIQL